MNIARLTTAGILLAIPLTLASGCNSEDKSSADLQRSHARLLATLHVRVSNQMGHAPKDEADFKQAIASLNLPLADFGVSSVDELFISRRDGKPLVVTYGTGAPKNDVIVYESEGVNGVREVGYTLGRVAEVDAAEFAKLVPEGAK